MQHATRWNTNVIVYVALGRKAVNLSYKLEPKWLEPTCFLFESRDHVVFIVSFFIASFGFQFVLLFDCFLSVRVFVLLCIFTLGFFIRAVLRTHGRFLYRSEFCSCS